MTTIPTTDEIYTGIIADLQANLGIANIPVFGPVVLRAIALMQTGKIKLIYLAIGNLQKNIFIDTAEPESIGGTLERFGRVKLNRNPNPAVAGQYTVSVTGTAGAIIPANTQFISSQTSTSPGYIFVLDSDYILIGSGDTISLRALTAGVTSILAVSDTLVPASPIPGVTSVVTVTAITTEPLEAETIEEYRAAGTLAYRLEPQGGAATDYRLWSSDAQGVAQSYPYARSGFPNQVNLYIEALPADSTDGRGTPSGYNSVDPTSPLPNTMLAAVQQVVNFNPDTTLPTNQRGRRPVTVVVNYLPVSIITIDINVTGSTWTIAQQTTISDALKAAISLMRPFVAAAETLSEQNDYVDSNVIVSIILAAIPGSVFGAVTLKANSVTIPSYTFINGNIPFVNTATFI